MKDRTRGRTAGALRALALILALCSIGFVSVGRSEAAALQPGDIVMAHSVNPSGVEILRLDPSTLARTLISQGPLVTQPMDITVDRQGRILVADHNSGIVLVDATSGGQSMLASNGSLGGTPAGICAAPDGQLFVSVHDPAGSVVRVSADGSSVTLLTSGDRISKPGGLAIGPDGALYVTEAWLPANNGGSTWPFGHGSIVRVDRWNGSQTVLAADSLFVGPREILFVGPDEVWTMQYGATSGRYGCFISTHLSDGRSMRADATIECRSQGMVQALDGAMIVTDCHTLGPDCYLPYLYTTRLPGGPTLEAVGGPMAIVPAAPVPVRRSSWGTLKTIYR